MPVLRNNRTYLPFLMAIVVIVAYYSFFLGDVIYSPNSYMNSSLEDGLKNYYTFAYHTTHSGVSLHFEGMNFPFGEHVIYTDGMPLFGFLLGWLPFLKGHEVGVLNTIMYGSILLAAVFIWRIFQHLKINHWIAAAGVIGIILLSPQFYRFNGHYGLSIMWIIPLITLQLLRWNDSEQKLKRAIGTSLIILLLFFIHPYMGLMSLVFALLSIFMFFLWKKVDLKTASLSIGIIAASAILFKLFLLLTDIHTGRTEKPSGLFEHYAMPETVFVPYFSPFKKFLEFFIPIKNGQPFEGWGYLGFSVIVILFVAILFWIVNFIRRKGDRKSQLIQPITPVFFAALLVLLFSMLIPLKWFTEDFIYQLKVFNQFRSVGRFSWVFYYVAGMFSVFLLNQWYEKAKGYKQWLMIPLIVAFPVFAVLETFESFTFFSANLGKQENLFLLENVKKRKEWGQTLRLLKNEKNAVLLPLPFFHIGSEHTFSSGTPEIQQLAFVMSYHAGIPMISSMMSRTSVSETVNIFKLLAPGYNGRSNLNEIKDKDLLILTTNQELDRYEQQMIDAAEPLYQGKSVGLYKLNYKLFELDQMNKIRNHRQAIRKHHHVEKEFLLSDSSFFRAENYNTFKSEKVFSGKGALKAKKSVYTFLSTLDSQGNMDLDASFWYYKGKEGLYNALVIVEEIDTITKAGSWIHVTDPKEFPILRDEWVLVEIPVKMKEGPFVYNLLIVGDQNSEDFFYIDNLIIRGKGINFSTRSKQWTLGDFELFNNVPLQLKE